MQFWQPGQKKFDKKPEMFRSMSQKDFQKHIIFQTTVFPQNVPMDK